MDIFLRHEIAIFCALLFVGCQREIELEFRMNEVDYPSFTRLLTKEEYDLVKDSVLIMKVGDTLRVRVSESTLNVQGIKSCEWIINGDPYTSNLKGCNAIVKRIGFNSIRLCINGNQENCITKYVYVEDPSSLDKLPPLPVITITKPSSKSVKVYAESMKVLGTVSSISNQEQIMAVLNKNVELHVEKFDSTTGSFEILVFPMQKGTNKITLTAVNAADTVSEEIILTYVKGSTMVSNGSKKKGGGASIELANYAVSGFKAATYNSSCTSYGPTSFTLSFSPGQDIELQSFMVFSETCGGLRLTFSGGGQELTVTKALVKGKSKISLGDLEVRLKGGINYMLTGRTIGNFGGCPENTPPRMLSASACGSIKKHSPSTRLTVDQGAADVAFDIYYRY